MSVTVAQSRIAEIELGQAPSDPSAELDVTVTAPGGQSLTVPAFSSGGVWRFRYSSEEIGTHTYTAGDASGEIEVTAREGNATLRDRGPIRVAADNRHFEHADGTPFLWVGDTWWHGFVTEKISDEEFRDFARQRADEGFSVVQMVVLPPEAGAFVDAVRCRTGWAWNEDFASINLPWWDDADTRIAALLDEGIVPCVVGSWGYHLSWMDDAQIRRHWREMVARWAALPVVWCLAGEPSMVWYDEMRNVFAAMEADGVPEEERMEQLRARFRPLAGTQLARFNTLARTLRDLDSFDRPTTTHIIPGEMPWAILDDVETIHFWMLQTGHSGQRSLQGAVDMLHEAYERTPTKPVLNGEPSYEGIAGSNWEDIQRAQFWTHMLSGAAGHTYGAHGVWAMNTEKFPGQYSGSAPYWKDAKAFSGSRFVGAGAKLLRSLEWWTLVPRPDLVTPHQDADDRWAPYAAELADGTRLVYVPSYAFYSGTGLTFRELGDRQWSVQYVDLGLNRTEPEFTVTPQPDGTAEIGLGLISRPTWADILVIARPVS